MLLHLHKIDLGGGLRQRDDDQTPKSKSSPGKTIFRLRNLNFAFYLMLSQIILLQNISSVEGSLVMKRLYEDLFTDYNRLILPVAANKTKVTVTLGLKLGQILDLNLKQQILSTNVWVEQTWYDHRLEWDPGTYGGIDMIHVPAENIWIPDIVLFNNADGNYELTLVAKAVLYSNGTVVWKPPTMFRSTCEIDVEYFPFDIQTCYLRFGSWTYAGDEIEIKHVDNKRKVDIGIDLSQFYKNVEWDIIDVPAYYNEVYYECCSEPFPDITFKIVIRRKMLFYLVNLILPVALMTFMTVSVFYLPADSNEKVTLSISILTSLIVFFLLMLEVIPPTSLAVPLFGKYLLFTLVLVSLSACVSVYVLNIYHRAPSVHQMSPRMRQLFLKTLPRLLRLDRPDPRERSSLNRFRKKKIAQQILQARQHNKVYDLAQPLATSLNLIETLQKSYDFNANDDDLQKDFADSNKQADGEEEGRYFRRYIDDFISQLESRDAQAKVQHQGRHSHRQTSSSLSSARTNNTLTINHNNVRQCCSANNKCCSMANKPLSRQPATGASCCGTASGTYATFGEGQRQTTSFTTSGQLLNDTFDMTFDYDDPEQQNQTLGGQCSMTNLCSANRSIDQQQRTAENDLPSPPPPPRQLTQLSDSMKDLSGRMSSCSQQRLNQPSVGMPSPMQSGHHHHSTISVRGGGSMVPGVDGQLVDKLISSINMINNVSDDIDTTPTTTTTMSNNVDEDYHHFKTMAHSLNSGPPISMTQQSRYSMPHGQQQQQTEHPGVQQRVAKRTANQQPGIECTCEQGATVNSNKQHQQRQSSMQEPQSQMSGNQQNSNNNNNNNGATMQMDSQAGTNIPPLKQPSELLLSLKLPYDQMPDHVRAAIRSILFIADTIKNEDDENSAIEDWESMSMVVDRLFLWIFFLLCTFGSLIILALAPSLYDQRDSIDDKLRIEIPESNCSALHKNFL